MRRKNKERKFSEERDLGIFGLAITLLAGLSAVLFKLVDYARNNIVNTTTSIMILNLVLLLLLENLIILAFFVTKGYIVSANRTRSKRLLEISDVLQEGIFLFPIIILCFTFFAISYFFIKDWLSIPNIWDYPVIYFIMIGSIILLLLLENPTLVKSSVEKEIFNLKGIGVIFAAFIFTLVTYIILFQMSFFLLCGAYAIEVNHFPDSDTDVMSLTIEDTGIPSGKCYIQLKNLTESNDDLFLEIDKVTLQELEVNSSKYMRGKKGHGRYYLFIDTADLSTGYYLLHAEVSYKSEGFNLFESKKGDTKLFYLRPRNTT